MDGLTEQQLSGVQSVCKSLIDIRSELEHLRLPPPLDAQIWAALSTAHAHCSELILRHRLRPGPREIPK